MGAFASHDGGHLQSMSTSFTLPVLDSTRYLASPVWLPLTAELPASYVSSSVTWRARRTCSRRSHLSAGMKYQLRMPKIVTAPRMTGAYAGRKSGITQPYRWGQTYKVEALGCNREVERRDLGLSSISVPHRPPLTPRRLTAKTRPLNSAVAMYAGRLHFPKKK